MTKIILALVIIFSFVIIHTRTSVSRQQTDKAQQSVEKATLLEEGVMTDKERAHSKLFSKYQTGRSLKELTKAGDQRGEVIVKAAISPPETPGDPQCPSYPNPYIVGMTHSADTVIIGVVKDKIASQLTEGGNFLFTDYEISIVEIIKQNPADSLQQGQVIEITRPGGTAVLHGKRVIAKALSFAPFIPGERYILFLKYLPDTKTYQAFGSGSFVSRDGRLVSLFSGNARKEDESAFVAHIKDSLVAPLCIRRPLY